MVPYWLCKNFLDASVVERCFRKRKQHSQKQSSVNMQIYFKKDDWTDFARASVIVASGKSDGDGGRKGKLGPDS